MTTVSAEVSASAPLKKKKMRTGTLSNRRRQHVCHLPAVDSGKGALAAHLINQPKR